jgi:hypothetical protein
MPHIEVEVPHARGVSHVKATREVHGFPVCCVYFVVRSATLRMARLEAPSVAVVQELPRTLQ